MFRSSPTVGITKTMPDFPNPSELLAQIHAIADKLPQRADLSPIKIKELRAELLTLIGKLQLLASELDHIKQPKYVFNPADAQVVGTLIARMLLDQEMHPMASLESKRFYGSGCYAIYYKGNFDSYRPIKGTSVPIYVGKVDPDLPSAATPTEQGDKLWFRLVRDHARNITKSDNLKIEDFDCRFLVVTSAWQTTAETYLIEKFKPVWNKEMKILQGFGKHGDKAETRSNERSPWDTLHPGRSWATNDRNKPNKRSIDDIKAAIATHFQKHPPNKVLIQPLNGAPISGNAPASASRPRKAP